MSMSFEHNKMYQALGRWGTPGPPVSDFFKICRARKARLVGYFLWCFSCQNGVKVKWCKDPVVSILEKPYIIQMCITEIHDMDIISIEKNMTKESKQTLTKTNFLWWIWKESFGMVFKIAVLKLSWTFCTRKNRLFLL